LGKKAMYELRIDFEYLKKLQEVVEG